MDNFYHRSIVEMIPHSLAPERELRMQRVSPKIKKPAGVSGRQWKKAYKAVHRMIAHNIRAVSA